MDEYVFQGTPEFEGHKFVNVGKDGVSTGDDKKYVFLSPVFPSP